MSFGQGVERIFPIQLESGRQDRRSALAKVRRAKLYYLRALRGKAARLKEVDTRSRKSQAGRHSPGSGRIRARGPGHRESDRGRSQVAESGRLLLPRISAILTSPCSENRLPTPPEKPISKSAAKLRLLKTLHCTTKFETQAWSAGAKLVAGIDEVGRGSLFGPVVAGAVILDPEYRIRGLRDSKLLPEARREQLAERIRQHCVAWAVAAVDVGRIDQINIYHASRLAMV